MFEQLLEPKPIIALALTTLVEGLMQRSGGMEIEQVEPVEVAIHAKVVVVTSQLRIDRLKQFGKAEMPVRLTPLGEAFLRTLC